MPQIEAVVAVRASIEACRTPTPPALVVTVTASWASTPPPVRVPVAVIDANVPSAKSAKEIG